MLLCELYLAVKFYAAIVIVSAGNQELSHIKMKFKSLKEILSKIPGVTSLRQIRQLSDKLDENYKALHVFGELITKLYDERINNSEQLAVIKKHDNGSFFLEERLFEEGDQDKEGSIPEAGDLFVNMHSPQTQEYAKVHTKRLLETFKRLMTIGNESTGLIVELGAASFYQQKLTDLFPKAQFKFVGKPLHSNLENARGEFIEFDLEGKRWPFDDASVTGFLCFEVLEHIFWDPMAVFAEANRCLPIGGYFVITTPNLASWRSLRAAITHYSPNLYTPFFPGIPHWESHRREYTIRDIKEFGRAGGFESKIDTFNSYSNSGGSKILESLFKINGLNTELRGDTIYAVFIKNGPIKERYPEWFYKNYENAYIKSGLLKQACE